MIGASPLTIHKISIILMCKDSGLGLQAVQ